MFLVHTEPCDIHAIAATCMLRDRGLDVVRCIGMAFPAHELISVSFGGSGDVAPLLTQDGRVLDPDDVSAVWYRRPRGIRVPGWVHESDQEYAYNECTELYRAFVFSPRHAFWINPIASQNLSSNKVLQLRTARRIGMRIPDTLVSNVPGEVREFVGGKQPVIYKPMRGGSWLVDGKVHGTYTTPVTVKDLPSDQLLQASPGIYQALVKKSYEVRAQFFGHTCMAIRIESNRMEYGEYDWRRHQLTSDPHAVPIDLPDRISEQCIRMMESLDIVSGAFDFIVDEAGEWVFLEVNPVGQFAFLERWCPELKVMSVFCDFIESRDPKFKIAGHGAGASLAEVMGSDAYRAMMADDMARYDKRDVGRRSVVEASVNHQQRSDAG